ncbi:MAG: hypothetical protein ABID45_00495 [Patescibacteria group bacterium]
MEVFFTTDLRTIISAFGSNPFVVFLFLMQSGGILIIYFVIIIYACVGWKRYIRERKKRTRKYVVLQLNIPKENEQSMKAVEKIFVQLQGAVDRPNLQEQWLDGWLQESFSFEIASINGHTSFFIHTTDYYRDLVESAVYAQYPDAEIFEVEDYTKGIDYKLLEKGEWKAWGAELQLTNDDYVPIRGYERFEHGLEGRFIDPMASILEIMSRLEPGEQIWYQVIVTPVTLTEFDKFKVSGNKAILSIASRTKLYGKEYKPKTRITDAISDAPIKAMEMASNQIFSTAEEAAAGASGQEIDRSLFLVEPERGLVTLIDNKVSQIAHRAKVRFIYLARKDKYQEFKGRRGILGALYQFNGPNNFKPGRITQTDVKGYPFRGAEYFFRKYRVKRRSIKLLRAFKSRDWERGENFGHIYAVDELASLYHFPILDVRAPFVKKAETKRVEPPHQLELEGDDEITSEESNIPIVPDDEPQAPAEKLPDEIITGIPVGGKQPEQKVEAKNDEIPSNIPFV